MYLNQIVIKYILLFFTDVVAYIEMVYSIFIDVSLLYVYILLNKNKNTVKKTHSWTTKHMSCNIMSLKECESTNIPSIRIG